MSSVSSSTTDFHVGWVSAVEVEFVAACELLDEEYGLSYSENNVFNTGRIAGHNVVLACLPKGKYGLVSAASVATEMICKFPSIRVALIVGIGGGAPSEKNDIRLGDVVVSSPTSQHGGVVHYEFGRTLQSREFVRTGALNSPPRILLSAIQTLAVRHRREGHHINELVQSMTDKNRRLKKVYQRPTSGDVLYKSVFPHKDGQRTCEQLGCRKGPFVIYREPRDPDEDDDPKIHYGLIASADRLMLDAIRRDQLSETEGILCFEMEAAGLMDTLPCLVIRGICDYSDSHKNDAWQGYAAATAAAYAKELLSVIPAAEVSVMKQTADSTMVQTQDNGHLNEPSTFPKGTVNNFIGTFSSQGKQINGGTFNVTNGSMYF